MSPVGESQRSPKEQRDSLRAIDRMLMAVPVWAVAHGVTLRTRQLGSSNDTPRARLIGAADGRRVVHSRLRLVVAYETPVSLLHMRGSECDGQ